MKSITSPFRKAGLTPKWGVVALYAALVLFASIQSWSLAPSENEKNGRYYRHYNNFDIFQSAHYHLLDGRDLYQAYPEEHWDLYKYSPTFALVFGVIAWLPDLAGVLLWNGLNAFLLLLAFLRLPHLKPSQQALVALIAAPELLTSMQSEQSNGLMAALMIFVYIFLEREKPALATGSMVASGFIKVFGLAALPLGLFYPEKWKAAVSGLGWTVALLLLPLLVTSPGALMDQYRHWMDLLARDHAGNVGFSVMGFLKAWFSWEPGGTWITITGIALLLLPWLRFPAYRDVHFRRLALVSLLIWVVIFNHMAESPTFVIAMAGIAIWYVASPRHTARTILLALAVVLITLSTSDIFPAEFRREVFRPLVVKVIPGILIWCVVWWEMMRLRVTGNAG